VILCIVLCIIEITINKNCIISVVGSRKISQTFLINIGEGRMEGRERSRGEGREGTEIDQHNSSHTAKL